MAVNGGTLPHAHVHAEGLRPSACTPPWGRLLELPNEHVARHVRLAVTAAFPEVGEQVSRVRVAAPDGHRSALGVDLAVSLGPVLGIISQDSAHVVPAVQHALMSSHTDGLVVESAAEGSFLNLRVDRDAYLRRLVEAVDSHRARLHQGDKLPSWRVIAVGDRADDRDRLTISRALEHLDRIWLERSSGITTSTSTPRCGETPNGLRFPINSEVDRSGLTDAVSIGVGAEQYLLCAPTGRPTHLGEAVASVLACGPAETVYLVGARNEAREVARVTAIVQEEATAPRVVPVSAGSAWSEVDQMWTDLLRGPSAGTLTPETWDPALVTSEGFRFVRDLAGLLGAASQVIQHGDPATLRKAARRLTSHGRGPLSPGTIGDVCRYVLRAPDPAALHA